MQINKLKIKIYQFQENLKENEDVSVTNLKKIAVMTSLNVFFNFRENGTFYISSCFQEHFTAIASTVIKNVCVV